MDYVQFRTSFRGFNKEDVVTFIDIFTKEKETQVAALQAENEQLRTMLMWSAKKPEPPKEEKTAVDNVADGLEEAVADMPAPDGIDAPIDLPQVNEEVEHLQAELGALNERNSALLSEKELLEQRLNELSAQNSTLLSEKQTLTAALQKNENAGQQTPDYSGLELAAYRRAEETERLARERANRIYAEIEEALNNGSKQSEIDTNELMKIAQSVNEDVARLQEKVGAFRENYRAIGDTLREVGSKP